MQLKNRYTSIRKGQSTKYNSVVMSNKRTEHCMCAIEELNIIIIKQLAEAIENMGNPFRDQSSDLYQLDTKYGMIRESVNSLQRIEGLGIPLCMKEFVASELKDPI